MYYKFIKIVKRKLFEVCSCMMRPNQACFGVNSTAYLCFGLMLGPGHENCQVLTVFHKTQNEADRFL